jgi:gas vesicle protein
MGDRDDLPYIVIERHETNVAPFFWGALLGAGLALLFAPRSGAETQRELRQRVDRLRSTAEGRIDEARETLYDTVDRTRAGVQERIDAVREVVQARTTQAREAVDAGRRAAREARSELTLRLEQAKRAARADAGMSEDELADELVDEYLDVIPDVITETILEEPRPELG